MARSLGKKPKSKTKETTKEKRSWDGPHVYNLNGLNCWVSHGQLGSAVGDRVVR